MSNAILEKHGRFRMLQAQYAAFITEQSLVTDQVISAATTARLEALDLELFRWEGLHKDELKTFGGVTLSRPHAHQAKHTQEAPMAL